MQILDARISRNQFFAGIWISKLLNSHWCSNLYYPQFSKLISLILRFLLYLDLSYIQIFLLIKSRIILIFLKFSNFSYSAINFILESFLYSNIFDSLNNLILKYLLYSILSYFLINILLKSLSLSDLSFAQVSFILKSIYHSVSFILNLFYIIFSHNAQNLDISYSFS